MEYVENIVNWLLELTRELAPPTQCNLRVCYEYMEPLPEARGWTKWEKLENNIEALWVGYQDHRHFPKSWSICSQDLFYCAFLTGKEQTTLVNSLNMKCCCQAMADSNHRYNSKIQDALKSVVEETKACLYCSGRFFSPQFDVPVKKSTTCLGIIFTTLPLLTLGKSGLSHCSIIWLNSMENNSHGNSKENWDRHKSDKWKKWNFNQICICFYCRMVVFTACFWSGTLLVSEQACCASWPQSVYINLYTLFP